VDVWTCLSLRVSYKKTGNKLEYVSPVSGEVIKEFRKGWTSDKLQLIIDEWSHNSVDNNIDVGDIDAEELETDIEE